MDMETTPDDDLSGLLRDDVGLDALFARLGEAMPGREGFGGDLVERGRAAYRNARARIRAVVCPRLQSDERLRELVTSQQSADLVAGAAAIASMLGSSDPGLALNSTIVAAITVRMGVRSLCADLPR